MSSARRIIIALLTVVAGLLVIVTLAHRPAVSWARHDRHSLLAWDLGNVASDAGGLGAGNDQRSLDMLDMSLDKIRDVYYKPVDESLLLSGERRGLLEYLKYRHIGASLTQPVATPDASAEQVDVDANKLLAVALDKYAARAGADNLTYAAIGGALDALHDPYTVFLSPRDKTSLTEFIQGGDFGGIGIYIGKDPKTQLVNIIQPIDGTPAARAGLKRGDIILSVGGKATKGLDLDLVMQLIRGKPGSTVVMDVSRGSSKEPSDVRTFSIEREIITVPSMSSRMIDKDIGYIQLYDFGERSADEVTAALNTLLGHGARAFILDLRDNGGGLLDAAVDISSKFIADGPIVSRIGRDGHVETDDANQDAIPPHPLVVLVNQYSASASEITAGAIQDSKIGVLIGQKTFGKGVVQTIFDLPGGSAIKVTTQRYVTPNGRDINKKGIEPNIVVPMDYRDVGISGKDTQLQAALRYLKRQIALTQHSV